MVSRNREIFAQTLISVFYIDISRDAMSRMTNLLEKLDDRAKRVDYYLRGLK